MQLGLLTAAWAGLMLTASQAKVAMMAPPPLGVRVAQAQTIVVGKVESFEEKTIEAKPYPGATNKLEYKIAVIKVDDAILNAKGITHVRVGFVKDPIGGPRPPRGRPPVTFEKDQEVLVFLQPHDEANFMIALTCYHVIVKKDNPNFNKEVEKTKKYVKMVTNPKESLKAEKQEDRYAAAAIMVSKYRNKPFGVAEPKTEAVDDEISKLILTALGEADWKNTNPSPDRFQLIPQQIFMDLGVTEKDGFNPPMIEVKGLSGKVIDNTKYAGYAKQWCKDNAGTYKIQRYVYEEKKEEKKDK
jgi:hypothetical protein